MLEGRVVLKKDEFLSELDRLLKEAGISRMGCIEEFYGRKDPAKNYMFIGTNDTPFDDVENFLDVTYGAEKRDGRIRCYCHPVYTMDDNQVIYQDGIFYEKDYYGSGKGMLY